MPNYKLKLYLREGWNGMFEILFCL